MSWCNWGKRIYIFLTYNESVSDMKVMKLMERSGSNWTYRMEAEAELSLLTSHWINSLNTAFIEFKWIAVWVEWNSIGLSVTNCYSFMISFHAFSFTSVNAVRTNEWRTGNASIQPHSFQLIEWIVWLNWIDIITVLYRADSYLVIIHQFTSINWMELNVMIRLLEAI